MSVIQGGERAYACKLLVAVAVEVLICNILHPLARVRVVITCVGRGRKQLFRGGAYLAGGPPQCGIENGQISKAIIACRN